MPTPAPSSKPSSSRPSDAFHIALLILCAVGFLVLYFKVDLDGSLNASYIANVSQQVERVERRMMMAEKKMNMMQQQKPSIDQAGMMKPPAMKYAESSKKLLAKAKDGSFSLIGYGACAGTYTIQQPVESSAKAEKYMQYDITHPIGPEYSDFGVVAVQNTEDSSKAIFENVAYSQNGKTVSYQFTVDGAPDCQVMVSQN